MLHHKAIALWSRKLPAAFFLLICVAAACAQTRQELPSPDSKAPCGADAEAQLLALINKSRTDNTLSPLTQDTRLTRAARKHTQLMVQNSRLSHQFPGEPTLLERFDAEKLASDRAGENVALDSDVAMAHHALMDDPPHRGRILDPDYNAVGIAVICSGRSIYVTEDFARLLPEGFRSRP